MAQEPMGSQSPSVWEQRWRERIAAWCESGLTQQAFCQAQGLPVSSFSHWKSKLAKKDAVQTTAAAATAISGSTAQRKSEGMRWSEVRWPPVGAQAPMAAPESSVFEIVLPGGLSVRVGPRFEAESLRRLLTVLEERSC